MTVLSCVGNTAISSGIDRLPRGQIVVVLLRWYRVYRQQTDRQTARHTALFGLISTAEINGTKRCMGGQRQHPVRAGGRAGRSYARQGAKTLPGTEGIDHKFNGLTDKLPHKTVISVTNKEINQGIKNNQSTDIKDKN